MHHLDIWVKRYQLDVACFIISLFNAQHVSDINTSILRSLRLICWIISWVVLLWFDVCWCYVVVWLWWCGIRMQAKALHNLNTLFLNILKLCRFKLRNLNLRKAEVVCIWNSCIKGLIESFSNFTKLLQTEYECFFPFIQNRVPMSNRHVSE